MDKIVLCMNVRCWIIFCFLIIIYVGKKKINMLFKKKIIIKWVLLYKKLFIS